MKKTKIAMAALAVLLLAGCAKSEAKPHVHTWEDRKCIICGEEKETLRLGNWEYILWEDTGTVEVTAFLESGETVPFRDLPEGYGDLQIGSGITAVPEDAFSGCENLQSVTIPQTVRSIGARAFGQCENLSQVDLSEGLCSIGDNAFLQCKSLTQIQIPDSVTDMGENPFRNTPVKIQISDGNPAFSVADGVLFDKAGTRLIFCPCNKEGDYQIPRGVREIGAAAFDQCNGLGHVTLPESLDTVVGNPFAYARLELKLSADNPNFSLVDGVLFDKAQARLIAYPCGRSGETYEIPAGTREIGAYAFSGCETLTGVTIPDSVTSIHELAFWNCEKLQFTVKEGSYGEMYLKDQRKTYLLQE